MIAIAASLAAAPLPTAADLTATYATFCAVADPSPDAIRAAALRAGWISERLSTDTVRGLTMRSTALTSPPGRPAMTLTAHLSRQSGERFFSCGVEAAGALPTLGGAVTAMTHAAPAISFGGASTTFALHDDKGWHDGSHLSQKDFAAAKAAGAFYSVMTQSADGRASVFSLNIRPDEAGGK